MVAVWGLHGAAEDSEQGQRQERKGWGQRETGTEFEVVRVFRGSEAESIR